MDTKTIALQMVRTVAASPERVFEVWTSSEQLERWTCPDPNAHVEVDIDLRVGGRYSICMEVEGGPFTAFGTYREIDPPRRLVYTWQWKQPHTMEVETVVTVEFLAVEGGTEIRLTHEGFSASSDRDGHETSWKICTAKLADLVAAAMRGASPWAAYPVALVLAWAAAPDAAAAQSGVVAVARTSDPAGAALQPVPKVLLIGIDGVRPDVLAEVPTPNINALAANGWYTAEARTTTPSVSGPSWSSMLTGVWPAKHGVTNNSFAGRDYDRYPGFLTRAERERPELATYAALDWLPLAELPEGGPVLPATIDTRAVLNGYDLGWAEADGEVTARAVLHLGQADPDAMFVYLGNPDETSHQRGSIGTEYRDAIALADSHVGMLIDAVRARPGYADENWLVLISTDHGRSADGGHGGDSPEEMTIFILASGLGSGANGVGGAVTADWPLPGPAFIVDVAATAIAHLGIEIDPAWALDGRPLGDAR